MADPFDPDHKTYVEPVDTIARHPEPDTGMTDDFDPYPLPETSMATTPAPTAPVGASTILNPGTDQDWDFGAPDGFWDEPAPDTYVPGRDLIIEEVAAYQRLLDLLAPPQEPEPEPVLYPGDIAVDEEGLLQPGPHFDPTDVDIVLSEAPGHRGHSAFVAKPDDDGTLSDGDGVSTLIGDDGDDRLPDGDSTGDDSSADEEAASIISKWPQAERSKLQIILERMPEVQKQLATKQGIDEVRRQLPELLAYSEKRLQVAKGDFRTYGAESFAGFVNDFIGAASSGFGNILITTSAEMDRRLIKKLSENYTPEASAIVVQNIRKLQADDPEAFRAFLEGLDTAYGTGSGLAADTGKALVSFSRWLAKIVPGSGIPADDMTLGLQLSRAAGSLAGTYGTLAVKGGRALAVLMMGSQAADEAVQEMAAAGIKPEDPAAPLLLTIMSTVTFAGDLLPFERLTGKIGQKAFGGKEIGSFHQLLDAMPAEARARLLGSLGQMAQDGGTAAVTGAIAKTINRIVIWNQMSDAEKAEKFKNSDMWDFVLRGQVEDAKLNLIMGAAAPQAIKAMKGLSIRGEAVRKSLSRQLAAARNRKGEGFSRTFMERLHHITGRPLAELFIDVGQPVPQDITYGQWQEAHRLSGDTTPLPTPEALARDAEQAFQNESIDTALDVDDAIDKANNFNYQADRSSTAPPPGQSGQTKELFGARYRRALKLERTTRLRQQFEADIDALRQLGAEKPEQSESIETALAVYQVLLRKGGLDVKTFTALATTIRHQITAVRNGDAHELGLNMIAAMTNDPQVIEMFAEARTAVRRRGLQTAQRTHRQLRLLKPDAPSLATIQHQVSRTFAALSPKDVKDLDALRRAEQAIDPKSTDPAALEQRIRLSLKRGKAEALHRDGEAFELERHEFSQKHPHEGTKLNQALAMALSKPDLTIAELRRIWAWARKTMAKVSHTPRGEKDYLFEAMTVVTGDGAWAVAQHVKLNNGLNPDDPAAPFGHLARAIAWRARAAVITHAESLEKAIATIRRKWPEAARRLEPDFELALGARLRKGVSNPEFLWKAAAALGRIGQEVQKITGRPFGKGDSLLTDGQATTNGEGGQGQQTPVPQAPVAPQGNNGAVDTSPIGAEKGDGHIDNTSATGEGQSTSGDDAGSGQHHPPKDPPDDDIKPKPRPPGTLYIRVEGGSHPTKRSFKRIDINKKGGISITQKKPANISFSAITPEHAIGFIKDNRADSHVYVFEVDNYFHEFLRKNSVPQENNSGNPIQEVDISKAKSSFKVQLSHQYAKLLAEHSFNARKMTAQEFLDEFEHN